MKCVVMYHIHILLHIFLGLSCSCDLFYIWHIFDVFLYSFFFGVANTHIYLLHTFDTPWTHPWHTLDTPLTHPGHTLTHPGHTLDTPWTHPWHTLDTPWTHPGHTLDTPWTAVMRVVACGKGAVLSVADHVMSAMSALLANSAKNPGDLLWHPFMTSFYNILLWHLFIISFYDIFL